MHRFLSTVLFVIFSFLMAIPFLGFMDAITHIEALQLILTLVPLSGVLIAFQHYYE
jgi:hypothetical protein